MVSPPARRYIPSVSARVLPVCRASLLQDGLKGKRHAIENATAGTRHSRADAASHPRAVAPGFRWANGLANFVGHLRTQRLRPESCVLHSMRERAGLARLPRVTSSRRAERKSSCKRKLSRRHPPPPRRCSLSPLSSCAKFPADPSGAQCCKAPRTRDFILEAACARQSNKPADDLSRATIRMRKSPWRSLSTLCTPRLLPSRLT